MCDIIEHTSIELRASNDIGVLDVIVTGNKECATPETSVDSQNSSRPVCKFAPVNVTYEIVTNASHSKYAFRNITDIYRKKISLQKKKEFFSLSVNFFYIIFSFSFFLTHILQARERNLDVLRLRGMRVEFIKTNAKY